MLLLNVRVRDAGTRMFEIELKNDTNNCYTIFIELNILILNYDLVLFN